MPVTQATGSGCCGRKEVPLVSTYTDRRAESQTSGGEGGLGSLGGDLWPAEATGHMHRTAQRTHVGSYQRAKGRHLQF